MLVRRYGNTVQSVEPNFDARAMTEIGFRRTSALSLPGPEFDASYERKGEHLIEGTSDAAVQKDAEDTLLATLLRRLNEVVAATGDGEVLMFENEQGKDFPKLREQQKGVILEGQNRIHFYWHLAPAIRLGVYRKRA